MKWYRVLSSAFAGCIILAMVGVLSLCSFHVYNADLVVPLDHVEMWMVHMIALLPIAVLMMVVNAGCLPLIFSDGKKRFFIGMLVGNGVCIVITLYFTVTFALQMGTPPATGDFLFRKVKQLILSEYATKNETAQKWIPKWLDKVQRNSKSCCGVLTFRDWEELWPATPDHIPQSCCKDPASVTKCVTDFQKIPFPGTPSMFVKTDSGCVDEINEEARKGIASSFIMLIIVSVLVALAEVAYAIQFYQQYVRLLKSSKGDPVLPVKTPQDTQGTGNSADPNSLPDDSGSGLVGSTDFTGSSVGSVDTTGAGASANFPPGDNPGPLKFGSGAKNKQKSDGTGSPGIKFGPSGISGTIVGAYDDPTQEVAGIGSSSSFDSDEDDDGERRKKKKKKKNKKDKLLDPASSDGNNGTEQPATTPEYTVVNADDDFVGDTLPNSQDQYIAGRNTARGKIFGMTRNRKKE